MGLKHHVTLIDFNLMLLNYLTPIIDAYEALYT